MSKVKVSLIGKTKPLHSECCHCINPQSGLRLCGCGGELALRECPNENYITTFYVECTNRECGLSVGRRYDTINKRNIGEFTDEKSAIDATSRAMGWQLEGFNPPSNWCGEEAIQ